MRTLRIDVARSAIARKKRAITALKQLRDKAYAAHFALNQSLRLPRTEHTVAAWKRTADKLKVALDKADEELKND